MEIPSEKIKGRMFAPVATWKWWGLYVYGEGQSKKWENKYHKIKLVNHKPGAVDRNYYLSMSGAWMHRSGDGARLYKSPEGGEAVRDWVQREMKKFRERGTAVPLGEKRKPQTAESTTPSPGSVTVPVELDGEAMEEAEDWGWKVEVWDVTETGFMVHAKLPNGFNLVATRTLENGWFADQVRNARKEDPVPREDAALLSRILDENAPEHMQGGWDS